ncbi:hypothetical protein J4216_02875 [Candidatus Woesearchaeota archaeon]|nr:hypothetical protein [Candidatus Woesearchaeota archaeon]
MKHNLIVTLTLIFLFLISHLVGFFIINHYLPEEKSLPLGIEKPKLDPQTSFIPIFLILLGATLLALLLIKLGAFRIWKAWFFLSIFFTLLIALSAFTGVLVGFILALFLALFKTFRPTPLLHNFTEIFIYGGLASLFVPILNIWSVSILLILISIYDMIAVWKTKHMVSMAKFQTKSKMFVGLLIPYKKSLNSKKINLKKQRNDNLEAILGGGDIAFPLMFSGVILKTSGFLPALIASVTAALALLLLFMLAKKDKFYPAMPFITAGSFIGYLLIYLLF